MENVIFTIKNKNTNFKSKRQFLSQTDEGNVISILKVKTLWVLPKSLKIQ